jgi:Prenyltransferase and squalene oxidase repeat
MIDWKERQNRDGGWAYNKGGSWTEPTAFVLLAQSVTQVDGSSFGAASKFLLSMQREDGGWRPQPDVAESTWVTAVVALLPEEAIGPERLNRAVAWLEGQTGRESGWSFRFEQWRAGNKDKYPEGWPWFPGAAAWVIPTSLGILAFERELTRRDRLGLHDARLRARVDSGREYLFSRVCADGGWNHGSNRALGRDGESYPETTGIALAALHRAPKSPLIERAKVAARRHLATCRTAEGIAWLRMGLQAHGENVRPESEPLPRTTLDAALLAIASAARNPLLS